MFMTKLTRNDLSIIDGWLGKSLTELEINFIFEIVEKRTEVHSTIFCYSTRLRTATHALVHPHSARAS